jgi:pyruvate kinase
VMQENAPHTKVVWSFSSHVLDHDLAQRVADEKVAAIRLAFHGDSEDRIPKFIESFRKAHHPQKGEQASIMVDLSEGSRAQLTGLSENAEIQFGEKVTMSPVNAKTQSKTQSRFKVQVRYWDGLFRAGAMVYMGYGHVVMKVVSVSEEQVVLDVIQGGTVYPNMEIHIPETRVRRGLESFDEKHLKKICDLHVEYLVLPGITEGAEITKLRERLAKLTEDLPWVILRIDSMTVYQKLEDLLPLVDGILISRRELALTTNPATIPMLTKEIIQKADDHAKIVLTASEMLGSMRRGPTPTRAEVSDIANAINDGSDALVLSEEVAHGPFAVQALGVMDRIIADTERRGSSDLNWMKLTPSIETEMDAIAYNAYLTAERVRARAIVCVTKEGNTALRLASYKAPVPVIAVTFNKRVARKLSLARGVQPLVLNVDPNIGEVLPVVNNELLRHSWLKPGDKIVFVSITLSSVSAKGSNLFTVQVLQ